METKQEIVMDIDNITNVQSKRIVAMGESFTPPPVVHLKLMKAAVATIGALQYIFVPTVNEYVFKEMKKQKRPLEEIVRAKFIARQACSKATVKGEKVLVWCAEH